MAECECGWRVGEAEKDNFFCWLKKSHLAADWSTLMDCKRWSLATNKTKSLDQQETESICLTVGLYLCTCCWYTLEMKNCLLSQLWDSNFSTWQYFLVSNWLWQHCLLSFTPSLVFKCFWLTSKRSFWKMFFCPLHSHWDTVSHFYTFCRWPFEIYCMYDQLVSLFSELAWYSPDPNNILKADGQ